MGKYTDEDMHEHSLIKSETLKPCFVCGNLTPYIEYCCEGRLCSTECEKKFYDELEEIENRVIFDLVEERTKNDNGIRYTLDEVKEHFDLELDNEKIKKLSNEIEIE